MYRGRRLLDSLPVAVKLIRVHASEHENLMNEVSTMYKAGFHPNIISIFDVGIAQHKPGGCGWYDGGGEGYAILQAWWARADSRGLQSVCLRACSA